jgi:hypothetical protein
MPRRRSSEEAKPRSPAMIFCVLAGVALIGAGMIGVMAGKQEAGLVHLASGLFLLVMTRSLRTAWIGAASVALAFVVLGATGELGLWVHLALALVAGAAALSSHRRLRRRGERRAPAAA